MSMPPQRWAGRVARTRSWGIARIDPEQHDAGQIRRAPSLMDKYHRAWGRGVNERVEGVARGKSKETHPRSVLHYPCQVESGVRKNGRAHLDSGVTHPQHPCHLSQSRRARLRTTPDDGSGKCHAEQTRRKVETSPPETHWPNDMCLRQR